jgi:hypothetical protein
MHWERREGITRGGIRRVGEAAHPSLLLLASLSPRPPPASSLVLPAARLYRNNYPSCYKETCTPKVFCIQTLWLHHCLNSNKRYIQVMEEISMDNAYWNTTSTYSQNENKTWGSRTGDDEPFNLIGTYHAGEEGGAGAGVAADPHVARGGGGAPSAPPASTGTCSAAPPLDRLRGCSVAAARRRVLWGESTARAAVRGKGSSCVRETSRGWAPSSLLAATRCCPFVPSSRTLRRPRRRRRPHGRARNGARARGRQWQAGEGGVVAPTPSTPLQHSQPALLLPFPPPASPTTTPSSPPPTGTQEPGLGEFFSARCRSRVFTHQHAHAKMRGERTRERATVAASARRPHTRLVPYVIDPFRQAVGEKETTASDGCR